MTYDKVPIDQLTPPQAIEALLTAGRVIHKQTAHEFLLELQARQNRYNQMWTLCIGIGSFAIGLYVGANYI